MKHLHRCPIYRHRHPGYAGRWCALCRARTRLAAALKRRGSVRPPAALLPVLIQRYEERAEQQLPLFE
jgi:hypothetical protein